MKKLVSILLVICLLLICTGCEASTNNGKTDDVEWDIIESDISSLYNGTKYYADVREEFLSVAQSIYEKYMAGELPYETASQQLDRLASASYYNDDDIVGIAKDLLEEGEAERLGSEYGEHESLEIGDDIGFLNTYGFDSFIQVRDYKNGYVLTQGTDYSTVKLNRDVGTLKCERWQRGGGYESGSYSEDDDGYLWATATYIIIDNHTLTFTSGFRGNASLSITNVQFKKGIPFLTFSFKSNMHENGIADGIYMPTALIDWYQSPSMEPDSNGNLVDVYYILEDYLH